MLQLDVFLLILRLLFLVLLYLFLMQVVITINRDIRKATNQSGEMGKNAGSVIGHLVVVDSGPTAILPGTQYDLMAETTIGRGPTNTIRLMESTISSEHTRMTWRKGTWYVVDAGSRNGTFVNKQPAVQPLAAKIGDFIQVGQIRFMLKA